VGKHGGCFVSAVVLMFARSSGFQSGYFGNSVHDVA